MKVPLMHTGRYCREGRLENEREGRERGLGPVRRNRFRGEKSTTKRIFIHSLDTSLFCQRTIIGTWFLDGWSVIVSIYTSPAPIHKTDDYRRNPALKWLYLIYLFPRSNPNLHTRSTGKPRLVGGCAWPYVSPMAKTKIALHSVDEGYNACRCGGGKYFFSSSIYQWGLRFFLTILSLVVEIVNEFIQEREDWLVSMLTRSMRERMF